MGNLLQLMAFVRLEKVGCVLGYQKVMVLPTYPSFHSYSVFLATSDTEFYALQEHWFLILGHLGMEKYKSDSDNQKRRTSALHKIPKLL